MKSENNLPIRDWKQESYVKSLFSENSLLNLIFEYTINMENNKPIEAAEIDINMDEKSSKFVFGTLISHPGIEIYALNELPEMFVSGSILNGSHIITGVYKGEFKVSLGNDSCEAYENKGHIKIPADFIAKRNLIESLMVIS